MADFTFYETAASGEDGRADRLNATVFPPDTTTNIYTDVQLLQVNKDRTYAPDYYSAGCALLRFNTSALAGLTITGATLSLYMQEVFLTDTPAPTLVCEYFASSNWPISVTDYAYPVGSTAFSVAPTQGAILVATLSNPDANISKTGMTGFRLGVSGGVPIGQNIFQFPSRLGYLGHPAPVLTVTTSSYGNDVNGVPAANIASINGVPTANIAKILGV